MLVDSLGCADFRFIYLLVVWCVLRRLHENYIGLFCSFLFVYLLVLICSFVMRQGLILCILG